MIIERKILFSNSQTSKRLLLVLEPWCEEYLIDPGNSIDVIGVGENSDDAFFKVDYDDNQIVVFGWTGAIVRVYKDAEELEPVFGNYR